MYNIEKGTKEIRVYNDIECGLTYHESIVITKYKLYVTEYTYTYEYKVAPHIFTLLNNTPLEELRKLPWADSVKENVKECLKYCLNNINGFKTLDIDLECYDSISANFELGHGKFLSCRFEDSHIAFPGTNVETFYLEVFEGGTGEIIHHFNVFSLCEFLKSKMG